MAEKNPNLCLLYGKETYFLENVLKKIKKDFGDLIKGINYITLDQTKFSFQKFKHQRLAMKKS